jgi:N-succinyldiaminopimelate aminotransferase
MTTTIFTVMTALAEKTGAINLGQGFPDVDGPEAIREAAVDALRAGHNQYAPLPGVPALREAIAEHQQLFYDLPVEPDGVQVTFGATEAIAAALLAVVEPGDEVLVLDPSYDAYAPITERAGGTVVPIELEPPQWRVTEALVTAALSPRTRVLVLNSPHNPTGRVLDADELAVLAAVCRDRDLIAITDEVYEHLAYDGEHIPLATLPGMWDRTITVSSLGKTHSFTGWKVGWASGPPELIARVRSMKQFLTFAGGTPFQHAAAVGVGLDNGDLRASLMGKRNRLAAGLREVGFDVLPCEGTYFLNATLDGAPDAEALCLQLPAEAGVVAIPLSAFTAADRAGVRPVVRFAFCKRDEVLAEAIERLRSWQ